jgi:F-type H+-transporting ATPase subunit delta
MANISRRRLAREVVRLLSEQPARRADIVQQLAGYVIDQKKVNQFDLLVADIADEIYLQQGHLSAEVDHAFDLAAETRAAITNLLTKTTGARTVELQTTKEPSLLGGVIIRTPRLELDASVRRKLKAIAGGMK